MITCKLIIKEMPDGRVAVASLAEQAGATKNELRAATVIDTALQAAGELLLKGKDIMLLAMASKNTSSVSLRAMNPNKD